MGTFDEIAEFLDVLLSLVSFLINKNLKYWKWNQQELCCSCFSHTSVWHVFDFVQCGSSAACITESGWHSPWPQENALADETTSS